VTGNELLFTDEVINFPNEIISALLAEKCISSTIFLCKTVEEPLKMADKLPSHRKRNSVGGIDRDKASKWTQDNKVAGSCSWTNSYLLDISL
jgi:hypothetical protein